MSSVQEIIDWKEFRDKGDEVYDAVEANDEVKLTALLIHQDYLIIRHKQVCYHY